MVNAVHVGCHDEPTQPPIDSLGEPHIGVVENGQPIEQHLKHDYGSGGCTQRCDQRKFEGHGKDDFERMETQSVGHIHIHVGVMHAVQPPQEWHSMKQHMLQVNGQVQQQQRQTENEPRWQRQQWQQAALARLGQQGKTDCRRRQDQPHHQSI